MKTLLLISVCCFQLSAFAQGFMQPRIGGTNLVGWWTFNDGSGTAAADFSGRNSSAAITNNSAFANWTNGVIGSAVWFNGMAGAARVPSFNYGTTFSVCAWVNATATNSANPFRRICETSFITNFLLSADSTGGKALWVVNNGSVGTCFGGVLSPNVWHLVCGTFGGTTGILYFDGVPVATNTFTAPIGAATPLEIGHSKIDVDSLGRGWNSSIDDVRIFNRALSADEVKQLYGGGYGTQ